MIEVGQQFTFVTAKGEERGPYTVEDVNHGTLGLVTLRREGAQQTAQVYERWLTGPKGKSGAHWRRAT